MFNENIIVTIYIIRIEEKDNANKMYIENTSRPNLVRAGMGQKMGGARIANKGGGNYILL